MRRGASERLEPLNGGGGERVTMGGKAKAGGFVEVTGGAGRAGGARVAAGGTVTGMAVEPKRDASAGFAERRRHAASSVSVRPGGVAGVMAGLGGASGASAGEGFLGGIRASKTGAVECYRYSVAGVWAGLRGVYECMGIAKQVVYNSGKKKKVKCSRKDMGGAESRDTRYFGFLPVGGDMWVRE